MGRPAGLGDARPPRSCTCRWRAEGWPWSRSSASTGRITHARLPCTGSPRSARRSCHERRPRRCLTPDRTQQPAHPRRRGRDLLAWLTLALATLAILWPLGLTNRVLAGVDALTYFTPYWAYRMAELRAGHLPLWNPYLFLGVPFLANPQAAVLYPLHWPLSWLRPEQALVWSALLHAWLAAGFTYTFARRSLRLQPAGRVAGGADLRPGRIHAGPRREHQPAQCAGLAARAAVALR